MNTRPWLVLAVGNPSRGDDALGPLLVERLQAAGVEAAGDLELIVDHQLQVEHALDLRGRRAVLFVDAARPGHCGGAALTSIVADPADVPFSHMLRPHAVLRVAQLLDGAAPAAWLLAIEGISFGLGELPSAVALRHLDVAQVLALGWLDQRRQQATAAQGSAG